MSRKRGNPSDTLPFPEAALTGRGCLENSIVSHEGAWVFTTDSEQAVNRFKQEVTQSDLVHRASPARCGREEGTDAKHTCRETILCGFLEFLYKS